MAPIFHRVVDRLNQNPKKNNQRMILTMQPPSFYGHYSKITCAEDSCHNAKTGVKKLENHVTTSFLYVYYTLAHMCMFGTKMYGASPCQEQKRITNRFT